MNFGELLPTMLAVASIASLAGLGFLRGTVTNLREQLADSRAEAAAIEASREREKAARLIERAKDQAQITGLVSEVDALQKIVTGEVHWLAIADVLDLHHQEATAHWNAQEIQMATLIGAVEKGPVI